MRRAVYIIICVFIIALFSGCGKVTDKTNNFVKNENENDDKNDVKNENEDKKETEDKKEIEERVISWYQNNHYMYNSSDEKQYSCRCDDTAFIYGEECYLAILYYKGYSIMFFAVNKETGEIFYDCADDIFIPLNRVMVLCQDLVQNKMRGSAG